MRILRLICALCVALLLHIALALVFHHALPPVSASAAGTGEAGLEIGLGTAGSYTDAIAEPTSEALPEERPEERPEPVKSRPKPEPEKSVELKPDPTVQVVVEQDNEMATLLATRESEPEPTIEPVEKPQPPVLDKAEPAEAEKPVIDSPKPSTALQRATGAGSDHTVGGKQGDSRNYFAELMAWLNQHKQYPREAKKEKQQGIVELQFTLRRDGVVTASSIKKSSGHALLDEAALAMLVNAAPLPALPASMKRDQVTLVIPIEFSLITNQRYKE